MWGCRVNDQPDVLVLGFGCRQGLLGRAIVVRQVQAPASANNTKSSFEKHVICPNQQWEGPMAVARFGVVVVGAAPLTGRWTVRWGKGEREPPMRQRQSGLGGQLCCCTSTKG